MTRLGEIPYLDSDAQGLPGIIPLEGEGVDELLEGTLVEARLVPAHAGAPKQAAPTAVLLRVLGVRVCWALLVAGLRLRSALAALRLGLLLDLGSHAETVLVHVVALLVLEVIQPLVFRGFESRVDLLQLGVVVHQVGHHMGRLLLRAATLCDNA